MQVHLCCVTLEKSTRPVDHACYGCVDSLPLVVVALRGLTSAVFSITLSIELDVSLTIVGAMTAGTGVNCVCVAVTDAGITGSRWSRGRRC